MTRSEIVNISEQALGLLALTSELDGIKKRIARKQTEISKLSREVAMEHAKVVAIEAAIINLKR